MSSLIEHSSGRYIANISQFSSTPKREYVIALVEGETDVPFWKEVFKKYKDNYNVRVSTNHGLDPKASDGKHNLLMTVNLSKGMVACVDADYDLWIKRYSLDTERICSDPFVFSTIYHSSENILLQDAHVNQALSDFHLDDQYATYLRNFSSAIYERLIDYLAELQTSIDGGASGDELHTINSKFHTYLNGVHVKVNDSQRRGLCSSEEYVSVYSDELRNELKERLASYNIHRSDCYKAVRGHNMLTLAELVLKQIINHNRSNAFHEARALDPDLRWETFIVTLGDSTAINELLHEVPLDESCVPAPLRKRLDDIYG
jgi:hypothetical protein